MRVNHSRNTNDARYLTGFIGGIAAMTGGYLLMLVTAFAG